MWESQPEDQKNYHPSVGEHAGKQGNKDLRNYLSEDQQLKRDKNCAKFEEY